ncbi:unnamed protein product [Timema podura]|uniref:Uncharacterized protein n=1 Tax=Timema podura TaxID=61482 RepID=A0ABN7NDW9_TIMPD|nr:unnamed protein product [Timema podura]
MCIGNKDLPGTLWAYCVTFVRGLRFPTKCRWHSFIAVSVSGVLRLVRVPVNLFENYTDELWKILKLTKTTTVRNFSFHRSLHKQRKKLRVGKCFFMINS